MRFFAWTWLALLVAACGSPPPAPPKVTAFQADQAELRAGERTTLRFTTEGTKTVQVLDAFGAELAFTGTPEAGEVVVAPTKTSFYLLRAEGPGGRAVAYVQVAVNEPLKEVFLVVIPEEVDSGEQAELIYSAPQAARVRLKASPGKEIPVEGTSGAVTVSPEVTTQYSFTAEGGRHLTAIARDALLKVKPVVVSFDANPPGGGPGETIELSWQTRGATEVVVSEATFGELGRTTDPELVGRARLRWRVPSDMPDGQGGTVQTPFGHPLQFTLHARAAYPEGTWTRSVDAVVGAAPRIDLFGAPAAVSLGKPYRVLWRTYNAKRVRVLADGQPVYEPRASNPDELVSGGITLRATKPTTTLGLEVEGDDGAVVRKSFTVEGVPSPKALSFQGAGGIGSVGSAANVTWTTQDAKEVRIRVQDGAVVYSTRDSAQVHSGAVQLYPALTTHYVLEAINAAGEVSTRTHRVTVAAPADVSVAPGPVVSGSAAEVRWNLTNVAAELHGAPTETPSSLTNSTAFVDLTDSPSARRVPFSDPNEDIVELYELQGFQFPFLGQSIERFWVSTNGFIAFSSPQTRPDNVDLSASNSTPPMLAPFWDDLRVGTGQVTFRVDGAKFPRRLIVQWTNVSLALDPDSRLTFQVQLLETGAFRFVYGDLLDSSSTHREARGGSATVGVQQSFSGFHGQFSYNNPDLTKGLELTWFASAVPEGRFPIKPTQPTAYTLFWVTGGNQYVHAAATARVFTTSSLEITEVMPVPDSNRPNAQWIELRNRSTADLDLGGLELIATASTSVFRFPPETFLPAGKYLLMTATADADELDGMKPGLVYSDIPLSADDTLTLSLGGQALATLQWTGAQEGNSVQSGPALTSLGNLVCTTGPRTKTFNGLGSIGTPGTANETCFPYDLAPAPASFEPFGDDSVEVLQNADSSNSYRTVPLPAPFTFFGQPYKDVTLSLYGFANFGPPPSYSSSYNDVRPYTGAPNGILAAFWDDLQRTDQGIIWVGRRGDHTLLTWQSFRIGTDDTSSVSFQIKLFDNGVVEYHYEDMSPGSVFDRVTGSSATAWMESPDGTAALPVSVNVANGLQPFTAWRFSPR